MAERADAVMGGRALLAREEDVGWGTLGGDCVSGAGLRTGAEEGGGWTLKI